MAGYRLSKRADEDFESIYLFGVQAFGLMQADAYAVGMQERFDQLAEQPPLYQAIDYVRPGYRRSVYGNHSIYYRMDGDGVLIVRILRNQNLSAALGGGAEN
ncbi:type II toxin-antitoxin system RelE/ParE family toxin [Microbulbifer sp.]|uniref:type II toxin-antitoxin system RelE/ParE family toxin n=1 Tax=Microbulbifer sp. TaxID=1908541 RepID=UPI003F323561